VRIAMQGPADAVIKAAARYQVVSFTSYEPSLEDIFLRYYEPNAAPAGEKSVLRRENVRVSALLPATRRGVREIS